MNITGYWGNQQLVPMATSAPRVVAYNVMKASEFVFTTVDGFEITLRIKLKTVLDNGQRDDNGCPQYITDFEIEPTVRRMLDDLPVPLPGRGN